MSRKLKHRHDADEALIDHVADRYLARHGLSFDFDAGKEEYKYQIAIADEGRDRLIGGNERDYFWGLAGADRIEGEDENDLLYGDRGRDRKSTRLNSSH